MSTNTGREIPVPEIGRAESNKSHERSGGERKGEKSRHLIVRMILGTDCPRPERGASQQRAA